MVKDDKMQLERSHIDDDRDDDQADTSCNPMLGVGLLRKIIRKLRSNRDRGLTIGILRSPNLSQRSSIV